MNRTLAILCTGAALVLNGWAAEGVRVGTESTLSDAPSSPSTLLAAQHPAYEVVDGVCVARDPEGTGHDVLGYDGNWYADRDGYWFRSRAYAGPYEAIGLDAVPSRVLRLAERARTQAARP